MPGALESKHTSVGLTLALTLALAVGLSLAPLPEAWRPIPSLAQGPVVPQLIALVTTSSAAAKRKAVGVEPDSDRNAPEVPVLPEEDETEVAQADTSDAGTPLPPPTVTVSDSLGLADLGPATRNAALRMEALREKMGARHVDLDPGCRRMGASGCEETGLAPFFKALQALRDGSRTAPVRVEHLGDSLIASDHITDVVRERLQERHDSGGKGFLYIDRPTRSGRGVRAGQASEGWEFIRIIDRAPPKDRLPFTGVAFTAGGSAGPQDVRFAIEDARTAEIFFLAQPGGGSVQVLADGKPLQRVQTRWTPAEVANARVKLPAGAKTLTLKTRGKVELHGVSLENGNPGVVYDTLGLPGAYAGVFLRTHRPYFRAQMRQRKPSLVVLMFGGNEAFRLSRDWTKPEEIKQEAEQLVKLVRESVPDAACLVWSPIDAAVRTLGGELVPRRGSRQVADIFREVAKEGGCAWWDALDAMGGEGAAIRWLSAGLLNEDLIHPRAKGSDLLGHLFDLAIQRAYAASHPPRVATEPPGIQNTEKSLTATFTRLRMLEKGDNARLGILQMGASHTASHYFTDAMRNALAKRFGDAGRGFIAAGKASDRLKPAGVSRELTGEWTMEDVLQATTPGQAWGLSGIRAVGAPGASLRIRFCEGCTAATTPPARLSLYWLDGPGSGQMEVKVDGSPVPPEPPPPEPFTVPTVRIRSFPVTGPAHEVEVLNPGGGPLTVLGAALDLEQRGVAYDAVGLPGSTTSTLASMDPQALAAQLSSRKPQLLVFWYGTNESGQADLDAEKLRTEYGTLIARLRKDAGGAECLVIGTTDRLQQRADGGWEEAPGLARVVTVLPEVARAQGCAYWSARAAMGGDRGMLRWQRDGLGHADGTHLTPEGYEKLAGMFLSDLLAAYEVFKTSSPTLAAEGG
ncbi:GDSL-type esterase/lipase family protein [Archangium sp.]|uniref:GDSL-type esterase/lipase family protein n=1 Tax=Archangium sp. TaxID=1872627 RepID=UPI002D64BCAC|nr:GDSL-type esterase/lipase family protein [Archangium sp.]HYO59922.1 GDSL-type esterase/lipase family protein [Archangium sp.]